MKVTVLGCGALGQLWLTALYKQGHEVQGWLRVPQPFCSVNVIETDGSVFNESLTANDPDFLASSELLIVTLKAWQVSNAVKHLAGILPDTSKFSIKREMPKIWKHYGYFAIWGSHEKRANIKPAPFRKQAI